MVRDEAPQPTPAPAPEAEATVTAPGAEASAGGSAEPTTLHDFCLNLLNNADAMKAFELDPQGCLDKVGLTDITPADVNDVLPLVTDLVPTGVGDLPALNGLGGVGDVSGLDALGGLPSLPSVPSLDSLTSGVTLDGEAGADGGWAHLGAESPLGATGAVGDLDASLEGARLGYQAGQGTPVGDFGVGGEVNAGLDSVSANAGVFTPFGNVEAGAHLIDGDAGGLAYGGISIEGPLDKDISLTTTDGIALNQEIVPGLSGNVTDIAGKGLSDPTAVTGALLGAVPALPAIPGLPQLPLSDLPVPELPVDLPVDLPLPASAPAAVDSLPTDGVTSVVSDVQSAVPTDVVHDLPAFGDHLPNVGGLLPELPVNLPVDLPSVNVPVVSDVVSNLPVVGGDASGHNVVGDVVGQTGLGNVINDNPVTDVVHNVVPDLGLL
ncbi:IniB N-terminal domain-containing protein [Kibdelosporangium aridum]|uniref:IniB N-terminal domain-containing protein n=1 Tax=Kibdelosporangium aridum TaxID=2030 RepID=UPI000F79570E|nr:IniB N-terminal domain-containing protein [Kibdelosporangium aridum]